MAQAHSSRDNRALLSAGFILLQSILYGFGNPISKFAFESIPALWCLALRFTLATGIFLLLFGKRVLPRLKAARPMDYLPAGLCMAAAYISCNLALERTSATNVGFLMSLPVIFAPVLDALVLHRPYRWRHLPVQLAVVGGLYLLCTNGAAFRFGAGDLLALFTALCVAGGLVFGKRALGTLDALSVTTVQLGVTALISVVLAFSFESPAVLRQAQPIAIAVVLYHAITCSCIAYMLQNYALTHLSSAAVSLLQCTQPILTAFFAWLLLGEVLYAQGLLGGAVILLCILAENLIPALKNPPEALEPAEPAA